MTHQPSFNTSQREILELLADEKQGEMVSSCCGAYPKSYPGPHGIPDGDSQDFGICPACGDHCDYVHETAWMEGLR